MRAAALRLVGRPPERFRLLRITGIWRGRDYKLSVSREGSAMSGSVNAVPRGKPALVCPAGSLPALKAAVDNGANAVYLGFKNATNARNFAGLNFEPKTMAEGIRYAQSRGREVLLAINTYAQAGRIDEWRRAVDAAVGLGVDALILADVGLLDYARKAHPNARLHLSVQGSATSYEAINF